MRRIASTTKESRVDDERHPRTASLRFVLLCALVVLALGNSPLRAQIADGSFETGTFAGWVIEPLVGGVTNASCSVWGILDDGESLDFAGRIHAWPVNGDVFPRTPLLPTTFHATEGRFVAVQLPGCVHDHHISQVLTIPPDAATLRWDMLYANHHGSFIEGVQDIQVTLRNPATKALLPGGMLFRTVEGVAPLSIDTMTTFSADVTAFAGATVELRFQIHSDIAAEEFRGVDVALDHIRLHDASGDEIHGDADADGVPDDVDNCPSVANANQSDVDGDGLGDLCDNCPRTANAGQEDENGNDIGDACETFEDGDIYLFVAGYPLGHWLHDEKSEAVVRFDPTTGRQTVLRPLQQIECCILRRMTHDPFRDLLILKKSAVEPSFFALDAAGDRIDMPIDWPHDVGLWVPTGDGRLYVLGWNETAGRALGFLDENDVVHDVLDESGSPLLLLHGNPDFEEMLYDVGTDSLFFVISDPDVNGTTQVMRIPLTPDGRRLRAPIETASLDVYLPLDSREIPHGMSAGPRGTMLVKLETNVSGTGSLFLTIDPVTLELRRFGTIDRDVGNTREGGYNSLTGQAIAEYTRIGQRFEERELRAFSGGPDDPGVRIGGWNSADVPTGLFHMTSIGDTINHSYRLTLDLDRLDSGGEIYGIAGERIRLHGTAFLRGARAGVEEWMIGVRGEGADVAFGFEACDEACASALTFVGGDDEVASNAIAVVDPDVVPSSGPLAGSPQGAGLVDRVVLSNGVSLPRTRVSILRFWIEVTVPEGVEGEEVRLFFDDGLEEDGSVILNSVVIEDDLVTTKDGVSLGDFTFTVRNAERLSTPVSHAFALTPQEPLRVFRLDDPASRFLLLRMSDADFADANALYFRQGRSHVPGEFELAADERFQASQRLAVYSLRDAPVFVECRGNVFAGSANAVTLSIEGKDVALESISTKHGSGEIDAAIRGAGFVPGTTFKLLPQAGGASVPATEMLLVSSGRAEARFVVSGPPGLYDLEVETPGGAKDVLPLAFERVEPEIGSVIEARLTGTRAFRYNRTSRVTLELTNVGDEAVNAPLFKIVAPEGTAIRLESEPEHRSDEVLVLGAHRGGIPGTLPPSVKVEIPIVFRLTRCAPCPPGEPGCAEICDESLRLFVLGRHQAPFDWSELPVPPGMNAATWNAARPALADRFGSTWGELVEELGAIATRLSRRGENGASVYALFRFAVREALGRPSAAVTGRITLASSGAPLVGATVVILEGGNTVASSVTDAFGDYAVDWLENGATYDIGIIDHTIVEGSDTVAIPANGDLHGVDLVAAPSANELVSACANCDETLLPTTPAFPPPAVFDLAFERALRIVGSWDPNDKEGSDDLGDPVPPGAQLEYAIYFENEAEKATAPAQVIVVTDRLDPERFDLDTFEVRDTRIGELPFQFTALSQRAYERVSGYSISPASARAFGSDTFSVVTRIDDEGEPIDVAHSVDLGWTLDRSTGVLTWRIATDTSEALVGVLPVNDEAGRGEGHVSFVVRARGDLDDGSELENEAEIRFDDNPAIRTPRWVNVIERDLEPFVPRFPRPSNGSGHVASDALLQWDAPYADETEVYLWREGDPEPQAPIAVAETFYRLPGLESGATYLWRLLARNTEGEAASPTWRFTVGASGAISYARGDANSDGGFDLSDAIFVLSYLFISGAAPTCDAAADANGDGRVDISDGISILTTLFVSGDPLPAPFPDCGPPPAGETIECAEFAPCL